MTEKKDADEVAEKSDAQKGLSQGAWVAIGTIAAALITGIVALLTHLLPPSPSPTPAPSPTPVLSTAAASPSPQSLAITADAIAGKWSGTAKNGEGTSFEITLEVAKSCALRERCGSISVSHVPCYGEVFLEKVQADSFEFHVANFSERSNRTVCQPGAGELFRLRGDGKLVYTTTYDPGTQGILARSGD